MDTRLDNICLDSLIRSFFQISDVDVHTYSPLALAYIGDSIYDLVIRTLVVGRGNRQANHLHRQTSRLVCAHAQSAMVEYLLPELSEEEEAVYRRGRNAKSPTMAKNATMADYRRATGFEALIGWLYLSDRFDRMLELIRIGLDGYQETEDRK